MRTASNYLSPSWKPICMVRMNMLLPDVALQLFRDRPQLATLRAGKLLISKPGALIFDAAKQGNVEFLLILTREYPNLIGSAKDLIVVYKDKQKEVEKVVQRGFAEAKNREDAISLVSSSASVVNFLSILTPRYAEEDFLRLLPRKLLLGLATLFISVAAMMAVFSTTFFILFTRETLWIAILVSVIASTPVILFIWQHFRLFYIVLRWSYVSDSLFQIGKTSFFRKEGETSERQKNTKIFNAHLEIQWDGSFLNSSRPDTWARPKLLNFLISFRQNFIVIRLSISKVRIRILQFCSSRLALLVMISEK
ncbi:hypothetical protein WN943_011978 [Citrus x changshan-huyou]